MSHYNIFIMACVARADESLSSSRPVCAQHTSALRGPGFGPKPGPARRLRAGPLHNFVGWAGPGPTYCGPGPGLG